MLRWLVPFLLGSSVVAENSRVVLARFDGEQAGASLDFLEDEDPVMGSQSYGNWSVDRAAGVGTLQGVVTVEDGTNVNLQTQ